VNTRAEPFERDDRKDSAERGMGAIFGRMANVALRTTRAQANRLQ
jgi:hypothetical protein